MSIAASYSSASSSSSEVEEVGQAGGGALDIPAATDLRIYTCDHGCGFQGQYAEVAAHEPSCGNRPGAAGSSEDSEDNSQDNLVECGGCDEFQPSERFDRNALADGAMFGGLCWDCLQTKEQQVPQHEARPSDVGAGASGEDDGFVSVAGLGSLQSASAGSSAGGEAQKPQETWLQKFQHPEIDGPARPPKQRGPAPGRAKKTAGS